MGARPFNASAAGISAVLALLFAAGHAGPSHAGERAADTVVESMTNRSGEHDAAWGKAQIVVYKSRRTLALYRHGDFVKEFRVVLGLQPRGRKRHANDARTPEGLYHVVAAQRHPRWQWFLAIDYPNETDRCAYAREREAGRIPDEDGTPFAIGGSVGIHGNDRPEIQRSGTDWTKGCIAMEAADIGEVAQAAPPGTPVWIVE